MPSADRDPRPPALRFAAPPARARVRSWWDPARELHGRSRSHRHTMTTRPVSGPVPRTDQHTTRKTAPACCSDAA
jgi:hypothetical protein